MGLPLTFIREVGWAAWLYRTAVRQFFKRVIRRDHRMRLPTGEWFALPRASRFASEAYVTGGDVDWGSEKLLFAMARPGGSMLDVGANIGYYALYMAPACRKVYAFEPDPRTRVDLEKSVAGHASIVVVGEAVGRQAGTATFVLETAGEVSHLARAGQSQGQSIEVACTTIDEFVERMGITDLSVIKIDIEGFDVDAVAGAARVLSTLRPVVLTEAEPTAELFHYTDAARYAVMAYARHHATRERSFMAIPAQGVPQQDTKMLFLVPQERVEELKAKAQA